MASRNFNHALPMQAGAQRYARRLKNLRIASVDTVDKGAGIGVDVLIAKRQQQEESNAMRITDDQVIQKFMKGQPRIDGDPLDPFVQGSALNQIRWQQEIAKLAKSDPKMTDALFSAAARREYEAKQHAGALGNGYQVAKAMGNTKDSEADDYPGVDRSLGGHPGDGQPMSDAEREVHELAAAHWQKMKNAGTQNWSFANSLAHVRQSDRGRQLRARATRAARR